MIFIAKRFLSGLLLALLILSGQQIASARASGPAVTEAVLCIGGGLMTVYLDAEGNPVGPPHLCPDATLAFLPDEAPLRPVGSPPLGRLLIWTVATSPAAPEAGVSLPPATGPPLAA